MQEDLQAWLSSDEGQTVHLGIFLLLVLGGLGFPIPEDLPLILAGVAAAKKVVGLFPIGVTSYLGVLVGDQLLYLIGYFFGERLISAGTRSPFLPALTKQKVVLFRDQWRKRRMLVIILARHLFPLRGITFLSAGALRIPYLEFLVADALAAMLSVSLIVGLGFLIGERLTPEVTEHLVDQAHFYILALCAFIALAYVLKIRIMRAWRQKRAVAELGAELSLSRKLREGTNKDKVDEDSERKGPAELR